MKNILNPVSRIISSIPEKVLKRKYLYLFLFVAATGYLIANLGNLKMDMTIEGWIRNDDPTKIAFNEYHAQFGSEDGVYIVYKPKDGNVFSEKSLQAVKGIQEELQNYRKELKEGEESPLDHIIKVTTLINARVLTVEDDFLYARQLVGNNIPSSEEKREELKKIAQGEKQFSLQYFSKDMKYGGIYIDTDFGAIPVEDEKVIDDLITDDLSLEPVASTTDAEKTPTKFKPTDQADYIKLNDAIQEILNKPEYAEHMEFYPVGNTPAAEYDLKMVEEMGDLYGAAVLIIIVLLWYFFRSFSAVTWSLTIVILSTIWTLGISALLGFTITGFLILTILLILTVGIADSVHIMSGYSFLRTNKEDHISSLRSIYKSTGTALLLTATTNMVGIIALNITPVVPIQTFAIMSTIGISLAFLFTIFLLPILMDIWKPWKDPSRKRKNVFRKIGGIFPNFAAIMQKILNKTVPFVEKRPLPILAVFVGVILICVYGATMVKVDSNMLDQYPKDSQFRENVEIADNHMMGAYSMVVFLDLGKENAFKDPKVLKSMDALQRKFEEKYNKYVVMTSSLADVAKDAYKKLNQGDDSKYIIPEDSQVLSQTLFMFNNASPEDRKRLVGDNYQKANIKISLHNYGSYEYSRVFEDMKSDISEMVNTLKSDYSEASVSITGIFALAMQTADYLTTNEVQSFGIAFVAICIILLLVFGSAKVGAAAMLPNLLPAILTFGLLGIVGIPLDFYTMMLAPIIIGISVDDTVTFITQYRHEVLKDGNIKRALRDTMKEAGQALIFTSLVLGLGFGIMSVAAAAGTSNMGKFGFIAIMAGLMCDLFFLPSLILMFKLSFGAKPQDASASEDNGTHNTLEENTETNLKEEVDEVFS